MQFSGSEIEKGELLASWPNKAFLVQQLLIYFIWCTSDLVIAISVKDIKIGAKFKDEIWSSEAQLTHPSVLLAAKTIV